MTITTKAGLQIRPLALPGRQRRGIDARLATRGHVVTGVAQRPRGKFVGVRAFTGLRFFRCCWMTSHTVTGSTPMMAATATGPHHIRRVSHLADHSVGDGAGSGARALVLALQPAAGGEPKRASKKTNCVTSAGSNRRAGSAAMAHEFEAYHSASLPI